MVFSDIPNRFFQIGSFSHHPPPHHPGQHMRRTKVPSALCSFGVSNRSLTVRQCRLGSFLPLKERPPPPPLLHGCHRCVSSPPSTAVRELALRNEEKVTVAARQWLDATSSPLATACDILQFVTGHRSAVTSTELVHHSIVIWERVIQDPNATQNDWLRRNPLCINTLLLPWKRLLLARSPTEPTESLSPAVVWTKLVDSLSHTSTTSRPCWWMDLTTLGIMSSAVNAHASPYDAPLIVERMLSCAKEQWARQTEQPFVPGNAPCWNPDAYTYSEVLQAWSRSRRPEASRRISQLWHEMRHSPRAQPTSVSYNIVASFYSREKNASQLVSILDQLQDTDHTLNATSTRLAIGCLCQDDADSFRRARMLLMQWLESTTAPVRSGTTAAAVHHHSIMVDESVHSVLQAYIAQLHNTLPPPNRLDVLQSAEGLVQHIHQHHVSALSFSGHEAMVRALIDMYVFLNVPLERVSTFLHSIQCHDRTQYRLWIAAQVDHGNPGVATHWMHQLVESNRGAMLTERMIATVVNAWAASSEPKAWEHALALIRRVERDPTCHDAHVRCNRVIWGAFLKCVTASAHPTTATSAMAVAVLDDLEQRHDNGQGNMEPDVVIYTLVHKACLLSGDTDRATAVWQRMEASKTPPTVRTYSDVLNHWCQLGTSEAAHQAEVILRSMKERARLTNNPEIQPNAVSYSIVLKAWAKSGDAQMADRLWSVYQLARSDGITPEVNMYGTVITALTYTKSIRDVQRADSVLREWEDNTSVPKVYSYYAAVINGFVLCGDAESSTRVLIRLVTTYIQGGFGKDNAKAVKHDGSPKAKLFQAVASAWIRAGDVHQATMIVEKMQDLHLAGQLPEGPDLRTYQTLLSAWTKAKGTNHTVISKLNARITLLSRGAP